MLVEIHAHCVSKPKSIIYKREFLVTSVKDDTFVCQMKFLLTFAVTSKISFHRKIFLCESCGKKSCSDKGKLWARHNRAYKEFQLQEENFLSSSKIDMERMN